jgi:TonB family protein
LSIQRDLGFSVVLHAVFLAVWALWATNRAAIAPPNPAPLWVELEEARAPRLHRQQIVRSDAGQESKQAAEQAYLGEKTRVVAREQFKAGSSAPQGVRGGERAPALRLKDLALGDFYRLAGRAPKLAGQEGAEGVSGEYVKGVREGESTALNTREFVFYGFFERIRGQLDRSWEPILREELIRHYKQGRRLASDQDHVTQVAVVLGRDGNVVQIEVLGESGTRLLDEAAVRAFNRAGPFPNPPSALLDGQGRVRIRWEFILKT